jgi:hypothetical protein
VTRATRVGQARTAGIKLARRGVRSGARRWWSHTRPSAGMDLTARPAGDARAAIDEGRAPAPNDRFTPMTTATGPWTTVQPLIVRPWGGLAGLLGVAAWGVAAGLRVRRDLKATSQPASVDANVG